MRLAGALPVLLILGGAALAQDAPLTPNSFLARGTPTFVVGTGGDDDSDRRVRAQVDLIRGMIFPDAPVVDDTSIDVEKGPKAWPKNPVLYGGPHVNRVLLAIEKDLPFRMGAGNLALGEKEFAGAEYRLIAVIPATKRHPDFLLYAGTGTPGVAEINGVPHGRHPLLVVDRFGPLVAGAWVRGEGGATVARLGPSRRLPWRSVEASGVTVSRLEMIEATDAEKSVNEICSRAVRRAAERLGVTDPVKIEVHVYPDRGSKRTLTGKPGDGHADVISKTLHVLPFEPGPLKSLITHEATHVISYYAWGPAGTPLLGEGLAVWAAGSYGGKRIEDWHRYLPFERPTLTRLLGPEFRKLPERVTYPLAGILLGALVKEVGIAGVRDHLYAATPDTWAGAVKKAGTTPDELERAFRSLVDPR